MYQKRPTNAQAYLRYAQVSKETYSYDKRDLFRRQKRPIHIPKETYECTGIPEVCASVKRDLL